MQDAYPGVLGGHEGHTTKSCCPLRFALLISRKCEKILYLDPSLFVCQLYCCSSKNNNNKALRITFNSGKNVSTSNMALATVNIDKIIKVTSASSYVYKWRRRMPPLCMCHRAVSSPWFNQQILIKLRRLVHNRATKLVPSPKYLY